MPAVWGHAVHIGDVHLSDEVARLQQPLVEIRLPVGVGMDGVHLEPEGRGAEGADELRGLGQGAVGVGVDAADGLEGHLDAQLFRAGQDGLHAGAEQRLIGLAAAGIPGPAPDGAYDQLGAPQLGTQLRVGQHPVHRGLAPLLVRQAQAQADEIFAQLDQLRRQQQKQINFQELNDAKAAVRHSLNQAQEALHLRSEPQEPAYAPSRPIEVGDLVELPGVKMAASVLAVNNDGTLLLQAGKMKMTVKAQQVRLPEGQPKKKPAAPVGGSPKLNLQSRASSELDIRGYETLEAESVVENYIDSAVMAKLGTVTIIHGKGTGALRKAVHEMLKRNKAVKSFRLGRYGEGEAGVTVVELK